MCVVNVNVGILGHVDSGKTSLARALSTQLSTAALDKHPQSQQRGITLDLGFSSFFLKPSEVKPCSAQVKPSLQVTLVDCPGHASLFRTILGGVAIIDTVLLVVDCRKGLQPQTIESLLLASLVTKRRVIVALTKTDLLSSVESQRMATIEAVTQEIRTFMATYFNFQKDTSVPVVPVAIGAGQEAHGIQDLLDVLSANLQVPERDTSGNFCLAVDHCFAVPGNGTVLTGTVLSGALEKGDELELLPLGQKTKVKTLQVFKQEVDRCAQGDRVGVRVSGLDSALVERALAVSPPGSLTPVTQVIIPVTRVPFFHGVVCKSGAKCHATVGHTTVIATATFFTRIRGGEIEKADFDPSELNEYVSDLDFGEKSQADTSKNGGVVFALLQFEHVVFCPPNALVVCSRLDLDAKRFPCRLAFYGPVQLVGLCDLQIGRIRSRNGFVDKPVISRSGNNEGAGEVIGCDMFSKDVRWSVYQDSVVLFEQTRVLGTILGPFGKAGKFRIALMSNTTSGPKRLLVPAPGEKFVLRFLKLMTLKPPKLKGKPTENAKTESKPALNGGRIERLKGETTADGRNPFAIVSGLFDSEQDAKNAVGSHVWCVSGESESSDKGKIEKPFGKAGKVRVDFQGCGGTKAQVGQTVHLQ
ncbi:Selenocysteine-specific elongation factor [Phytophthora megakarya]|uniref:Elongation factor Tu, chloroplastic n=1 Tax=Phytophthora megakarya TaxID=4795 RepID=A0A225WQG6_9STRA|nr:Selenocysteine-specific elongation factor [Phytophthora megakarya]